MGYINNIFHCRLHYRKKILQFCHDNNIPYSETTNQYISEVKYVIKGDDYNAFKMCEFLDSLDKDYNIYLENINEYTST